jgi:hypothetical protein
MQIPRNKIEENKYTNGTGLGKNVTLRFSLTKIPYVGYYNQISSKYFSGKTYSEESKSLEKYDLLKLAMSLVSIATSATRTNTQTRYFFKDLTTQDILIKEIDRKTYNELSRKDSPSYQVILYDSQVQTVEEVDKNMKGLKVFLET